MALRNAIISSNRLLLFCPKEPIFSSKSFFDALKKHNVKGELLILEKGGHGFGMGKGRKETEGWSDKLKVWIQGLN